MAKKITVVVPIENGEPLGAIPDEKLVINSVQPGTIADGKLKVYNIALGKIDDPKSLIVLKVGDQILKLNNTDIKGLNHFFHLLRFAPPSAELLILRDEKKAEELAAKINIPTERTKYITHFQNRVLVSRCEANSLSAGCLKVGDHIIDVDGQPVSNKKVCRDLLLIRNFVTLVVERPESMEAKYWVQNALTASTLPSVSMSSDVQEIAARQREKMKMNLKVRLAPPACRTRQIFEMFLPISN
ncbi:unnamed protein product [Dracunculus medinensis]|uniref:PDZ domain-containing protein n=1 Tax=Dracunculus medinensis TaxID=318479 RepID=A0A0N4UJI5_DRAME|nr:unnamed protein product [Dracunculus medinensis]